MIIWRQPKRSRKPPLVQAKEADTTPPTIFCTLTIVCVEEVMRQPAITYLAVGVPVILLHPPLTLAGVSIAMERERQQNDSLANG